MKDEIVDLKQRNQDLMDRQAAVGATEDNKKKKEPTPDDHQCGKTLISEGDIEYNARTKKHIDIFNDVIK